MLDDDEEPSKKMILSFLIFHLAAMLSVLHENRQRGDRYHERGGSRRWGGAAPMEGDAGERRRQGRKGEGGGGVAARRREGWRRKSGRGARVWCCPLLWPATNGPWGLPPWALRLPMALRVPPWALWPNPLMGLLAKGPGPKA